MTISYCAARVNAGLTQKQAAEALKLTPSTLAAYEKGTRSPKINTLKQMAELYKMNISDFF